MAVDGKPLDEDASEVEEALRADVNRAREDYRRTLECFRQAVSERGLPASEAASRIGKAFAEHELSSKAYNDAIGTFADFVFRGLVPERIKGATRATYDARRGVRNWSTGANWNSSAGNVTTSNRD